MALGWTLWGCGHAASPTSGLATLRRGLSGEPSTLDPAAVSDSFTVEVLQDVYEGLTTESAGGTVVPGVAESWTVDAAGTRYLFKLRGDARWSNGAPVRAQEFVQAWRRVVDPKQAAAGADDLRLVAGADAIIAGKMPVESLGVHALGDAMLEVSLDKPAAYFPQLLAHAAAYPIYSAASAKSHDARSAVVNGPYLLASWSPGTELALTQNPHYWDRAHVRIPKVTFVFIADENSQYARYRAGEIDLTDTVPPNAVPKLRSERSSELFIAPYLATAYYGLNLSRPPFQSNAPLRRALAMAIDRDKLTAAQGFGQAPAYGFVPPGTLNYAPQSWRWQSMRDAERIAEAKRLYAEAGYSAAHPLRLRLLFHSNIGIKNAAIIVASMWKDVLGIDTELVEEEYRVFLESRHDKTRWDVVRLAWTADYNDAGNFLDTFRAKSANNDAGYDNRDFDRALDAAAATPDAQARRALLQAGERTLLEDYPVLPLYFFVSKRLVKPYLHGIEPNPLNHIHSKNLYLDPTR